MKKHVYFILLFLSFFACKSNNDSIDDNSFSAKDSLNLSKRIALLSNYNNSDSLIFLSQDILDDYPQKIAESSIKIAHVFYNKSNFYLSKKYFKKAANVYWNKGMKEQYAEQITNIGVLNEVSGNYPSAIDNYLEALSIFDSLGLELKSSSVYNNLGIIYQQIGNKDRSLNYYKKSVKICQKLKREDLCYSKFNNIASVYEEFDNNLDSALYYYLKSLELLNKDSVETLTPTVEANIANIYIQQNKLNIADSILNEAYKKVNTNQNSLFPILEFKAILALKNNNCDASKKLAQRVVNLAQKNSFKEQELKGLKILIDCYEKEKNYEKAYNHLKTYNDLKFELAGIEQQKEIERLNTKYNVQQKDNKIKVLELQKEISAKRTKIWSIIGGLVIVSLLILLYTFYIQKKHSQLKIKSMQRDISDYIKQLHNFEEEIHEQELTHKELFLQKIKQFDLTEREEEVLLYISQGLKNTEIAEKMFVSVNTIKTHIKNIFVKLDVRNRIEAANKAKAL